MKTVVSSCLSGRQLLKRKVMDLQARVAWTKLLLWEHQLESTSISLKSLLNSTSNWMKFLLEMTKLVKTSSLIGHSWMGSIHKRNSMLMLMDYKWSISNSISEKSSHIIQRIRFQLTFIQLLQLLLLKTLIQHQQEEKLKDKLPLWMIDHKEHQLVWEDKEILRSCKIADSRNLITMVLMSLWMILINGAEEYKYQSLTTCLSMIKLRILREHLIQNKERSREELINHCNFSTQMNGLLMKTTTQH